MTVKSLRVLVVGATGSIGRLVVEEALRQGHVVRVLARSLDRAASLPTAAQRIVGDLTRPESLTAAVDGVEGVVFTHGSDGQGMSGAEHIDYGGVRNVLVANAGHATRVALMTSIGVTDRLGAHNRSTEGHDWKRRGERLVRASGLSYTIVRPGWFDYNAADQHRLLMLQGDRRHAGDSSDGVVSRRQIAEVLVHSLTSEAADRKTFELVAERGPATTDLDALLTGLVADAPDALDAARDATNMPLTDEPGAVRADLQRIVALGR